MHYVNPLGVDKIMTLILRFSLPAVVGMMVNSLYNIVDRMFIGNEPSLGTDGLAGITISFPITIILMSVGVLFGIGGATYFAIKLGEGKPEEAERALGTAFGMLLFSGLVFMVLGQIFLRPLLTFFGASETVLPFAVAYMRVIFFGASFQIISMGMNHFIRADGSPRFAMFTMFISAGINIALDALFIYGFHMGMAGAALATVLAQAVSAIWVLFYFRGSWCKIRLKWKYLVPRLSLVLKLAVLGLPGFFLQLANSLINIIMNKSLLFYGGDIAVSGMGVLHSLHTVMVMPVIGLRQGVQPIISFNYGARKLHRTRKASNLAILIATGIMLIGFTITRLFPTQLFMLFNRDPALLEFGGKASLFWFFGFPVVGLQVVASNFFQSIGRPKTAVFLTLTRQIIFFIPLMLVMPLFIQIDGLLLAKPAADILSAAVTGIWYVVAVRNLERDTLRLDTLQAAQTALPADSNDL